MKTLTRDEVEELTEHLASRKDIWYLHNNVWVRIQDDEKRRECTSCKGVGQVVVEKIDDVSVLAQCRGCKGLGTVPEKVAAFALKMRNGLPDEMYALTHKAIFWSQESAEEYVVWLLEKYTAYSLRREVKKTLLKHNVHSSHIDALSRDLCNLHGGSFVRKYSR